MTGSAGAERIGVRAGARLIGPGCLVAGMALLAYALRIGAARIYLILVIPVFTGSTGLFLLATALLVAGVFLLPLSLVDGGGPDRREEPGAAVGPPAVQGSTSAGGVVLFGPVPVFFGSWRKTSPISYRWAVVVGVLLAVVALLVFWGLAWL